MRKDNDRELQMQDTHSPDTLALFTKLLNLPDITVTKISQSSNEREVTFTVKSTAILGELKTPRFS